MKNITKEHMGLKITLALLPAVIFTQNYAWMTSNAYLLVAFLIILALMIWSTWQFTEKNHILERYFRLTEVAFFLLPISAIILSFVVGSQAVSSTSNEFEQAGAALGTAIGGAFVVILAFIIGLAGGVIMHLIANKYDKKAEKSGSKQLESLSNKHGVILPLVAVFVLAVIMGSILNSENSVKVAKMKEELSINLQQGGIGQVDTANVEQMEEGKVTLEIIEKGFNGVDYRSGNYQEQITMSLKFTNTTEKEIRGVEGIITFYDIFDNKISATKVGYDKGIPMNDSIVWEAGIDYNQFMNEDIKLKDVELENLKYEWEILTIIYSDESKESF